MTSDILQRVALGAALLALCAGEFLADRAARTRIRDARLARLGELETRVLEADQLAPGTSEEIRTVVETEGHGLRESTSFVRPSSEVPMLEIVARQEHCSEDGTVLIAGATCRHVTIGMPHFEKEVIFEPYWINGFVVTNREYRLFLADNPKIEPPLYFERIDWNSRAEDPVTDVSWEDARAFAEWHCKRLPTYWESMLAEHGAGTGRPWPW